MTTMANEFKYYSSVYGRVVPRFGTSSYIGAVMGKDGFEWDEVKIVAIPMTEFARYRKEYTKNVKNGSIMERTLKDREDWISESNRAYSDESSEPDDVVDIENLKKMNIENLKKIRKVGKRKSRR